MSEDTYRRRVASLSKEMADLRKRRAAESDRLARKVSEINRIEIRSRDSASTTRSKQRQVESKLKEAARIEKTIADADSKLATKIKALGDAEKNLNREVQRRDAKAATSSKKRIETERRHSRDMVREAERTVSLKRRAREIVVNAPAKITVLFFAADPQDSSDRLLLDEEVRAIQQRIRESKYRDSVELHSRWAVRTTDLLQAINELDPTVVHFSGHGSDSDEIVFLDEHGNAKFVTKEAITQMIAATGGSIRLIVFNTCYSHGQASAVVEHVDAAIGMNTSIGDNAARVFAAQFYSAIGFGKSVAAAFDQARAQVMLEGIDEHDTPELFVREGVAAGDIVLVDPEGDLDEAQPTPLSQAKSQQHAHDIDDWMVARARALKEEVSKQNADLGARGLSRSGAADKMRRETRIAALEEFRHKYNAAIRDVDPMNTVRRTGQWWRDSLELPLSEASLIVLDEWFKAAEA